MAKARERQRGISIPQLGDTRDIEGQYGPDSGMSFPGDGMAGYGSGGVEAAPAIPTDNRRALNGAPKGRRR